MLWIALLWTFRFRQLLIRFPEVLRIEKKFENIDIHPQKGGEKFYRPFKKIEEHNSHKKTLSKNKKSYKRKCSE